MPLPVSFIVSDAQAGLAADIRSIFLCPDLPSASARLKDLVQGYTPSSPKLALWMENNLPQGFAVFSLPITHQRRMRTSYLLERVNQEINTAPASPPSFPTKPRSSDSSLLSSAKSAKTGSPEKFTSP